MPHHKFKLIVFLWCYLISSFCYFSGNTIMRLSIADDGISGEKSVSLSGNLRPIDDPMMM